MIIPFVCLGDALGLLLAESMVLDVLRSSLTQACWITVTVKGVAVCINLSEFNLILTLISQSPHLWYFKPENI